MAVDRVVPADYLSGYETDSNTAYFNEEFEGNRGCGVVTLPVWLSQSESLKRA